MKTLIFAGIILLTNQALASSLDDALAAAISSSDKEKVSKQVILNVEPNQIAKATFKKGRKVEVITVQQDLTVDALPLGEEEVMDEAPAKLGAKEVAQLK